MKTPANNFLGPNPFGLIACFMLLAGCGGVTPDGNNSDIDNNPGQTSGRTLSFYYGPLKLMFGENILDSIEAVTGYDFGSWDFTAPEPATNDNDPASYIFTDAGNGPVDPDNNEDKYYVHCRLLGGCMEHRIPLGRTSFLGTAFVLEFGRAVSEACYDRATFGMFPPDGNGEQDPDITSPQAIDIINHQYLRAFGVAPSAIDLELSIDYFEQHVADPEFTDNNITPIESAGRGHCRALLTTNRFIFY